MGTHMGAQVSSGRKGSVAVAILAGKRAYVPVAQQVVRHSGLAFVLPGAAWLRADKGLLFVVSGHVADQVHALPEAFRALFMRAGKGPFSGVQAPVGFQIEGV